MRKRTTVRAATVAALTSPALVVAASGPATATASEPEETIHCSTRLLTPAEVEAGVKSQITCSTSISDALAAQGLAVDPASSPDSLGDGPVGTLDSSGLVAIHYDGAYASGSSLSVVGSVCDGGGISFSSGDWWNDRISSTRHQACSTIKHWEHANYTGTAEITQNGSGYYSNLGSTNNVVSSIRYYGPPN